MFLVLFGSLLFVLLMFLKYAAAMLNSVPLLCQFSVKMSFEKFHCGGTSLCIFFMLAKENLWILPLRYVVRYFWIWFYLYICWCFPKNFEIARVIGVFMIVTSRKLSCLFSFRIQSCTILIDLDWSGCLKTPWLFSSFKPCMTVINKTFK